MRPGTLLRWYALKNILKSEIHDNLDVYDLGGYDGFVSNNLKKLYPNLNITVVDTDRIGLNLAKERGLNTLYSSALKLPFENKNVDVVLCLDLIEHVQDDEKLINGIARILKENGIIILTTPMKDGISFPFLSKDRIDEINKKWGHLRKGYSLECIKEIFEKNGLLIERNNGYFNFLTRLAYRFTILSKIPLKGKKFLYHSVIKLEPFIKIGTQEHIIIGKKRKK